MKTDVREIIWACVSPKQQAHQMCRWCHRPATHMKKIKKFGWVGVCPKHAGLEKGAQGCEKDSP